MSELRGLGEIHKRLVKAGGTVAGVSVDEPKLASKVVRKNNLSFPILCDTDRELIKRLGLVHESGAMDGSDIPIPAHLLINKDGKIAWRFVSPRVQVRPDPMDVLDKIQKAGY
ncbi:MAG: peroxiredoxin family protein [Planctomycetota bacterium]|jgi:peroxiredoxin